MSMEAYAFCLQPIDSMDEWQASIHALGFDLVLHSTDRIADRRGHLPATWRGREAGFEVGPCPFAEVARTYDDVDLGGPWTYAYAFHFGTLPGCVGTWFALAACLRLTGGLAFDPQEGKILTPEQAVRYAREAERGIDQIEAHTAGAKRH